MADRIRHIKGRNLVVCEIFDDFAAAVEKTDFTVEDVVGYVVSLTNNYYWLNVESVWGAIGFTWDSINEMSPEESAQYLNLWKRMEHVLSTGYNIDKKNPEDPDEEIPNDRPDGPMPGEEGYELSEANKFDIAQKERTSPITKGYGHFNRSTVPFSHIPALPDGYRIIAITGDTLANINPDIKTLYIDKSDWKNLTNIDNLCNRAITLYANLDGSNIESASRILQSTGKLYLKADLSNIANGTYLVSSNSKTVFAANDYYKDMNIPIGEDSSFAIRISSRTNDREPTTYSGVPVFKWEGEGSFTLEHFFKIKNYNNVYIRNAADPGEQGRSGKICIWSDNGLYYINNFKNDNDNTKGLYPRVEESSVVNQNTVSDITIDCTNGISNVRVDYDLASNAGGNYTLHRFLPIKYVGNVSSIGIYNPYLRIEDDEWPEYNQTLVNKLNPEYGQWIFKGINIVKAKRKCPYTVDVRNLDYIRVFSNFGLTVDSNYENYYYDGTNRIIDIYPNIIVDESKVYTAYNLAAFARNSAPYIKVPDIKVKAIQVDFSYYRSIYIGKNAYFTCNKFNASSVYLQLIVHDASTPFLTIKKLSDTDTLYCYTEDYNITWYNNTQGEINLFVIDAEDEDLKAGTITTGIIDTSSSPVTHPLVVTNNNRCNAWCHYTDFRLIYHASITLAYNGYTNAELLDFVNSIEAKTNTNTYIITLYNYIYERLDGQSPTRIDDHNYIADIVALGYNVDKYTPVQS